MATPKEIKETLDSINNETERDLAEHILKGTRLLLAPGNEAIEDENLYLRKIQDWASVGSIGMCELNIVQMDRLKTVKADIELNQANRLLKDFSHPVTQSQTQSNIEQRKPMLSSFKRVQAESKPVSITPVQPVSDIPVQPSNDLLAKTKEIVLTKLKDRLTKVMAEPKGFRPGHQARLFALNEIIEEVGKENGKFTLDQIEDRISARLSDNDNLKFLKGIRADSSSKKGHDSQYQIMKNEINQLTTPKESVTLKTPKNSGS